MNSHLSLMNVKAAGIIIAMLFSFGCLAQPANIFLRRGIQIRTEVTAITDAQLFTNKEVYTFDQVLRINFWEDAPDSASILTLRHNGIAVYLKKQRLAPIVKKVEETDYHSLASIGLGLGLDYGGIGTKAMLYPAGPLSLFLGLGYNTVSPTANMGMEIKFSPKRRSSGYLTAMFGFNGVVDSETYYGLSVGLGVKVRAAKSDKNFFSTSVLYPFRPDSFTRAAQGAYVIPMTITLGFNFGF